MDLFKQKVRAYNLKRVLDFFVSVHKMCPDMTKYATHRLSVCKALSTANDSIYRGWEIAPDMRESGRDVHFEISQLLELYKLGKIDMELVNQAIISTGDSESMPILAEASS